MSGLVGLTVTNAAFLPRALVLARSWAEHHGRPMTVVYDGTEPAPVTDPAMRIVGSSEVVPPAALAQLRALYGHAVPLNLKAWALLKVLDEGAESVLYLDADGVLYGAVDDVGGLAAHHGLVLTPHLLAPADVDTERIVALAGAMNAGFVAAAPAGRGALQWWAQRCHHDARAAPNLGVFGDQRWLDLLVGRSETVTCTDPGLNVVWTRLLAGDIAGDDARPALGGRPLRHLHTGGAFDPERPWTLGPGVERHGLALDTRPKLSALLREYAAQVLRAGHLELRDAIPPGLVMADGTPVDATMRALYREALLTSRRAGDSPPPGPFDDDGGEAFRRWLREPVDRRRHAIRVSRYLMRLATDDPQLSAATPASPDDSEGELATLAAARAGHAAVPLLDTGLRHPRDVWVAPRTQVAAAIIDVEPGLDGWTHTRWAQSLLAAGDPRTRVLPWHSVGRERNDSRLAGRLRSDVFVLVASAAKLEDLTFDLLVDLPPDRIRVCWWPAPDPVGPLIAGLVDEVWVADENAAASARVVGVRARVVPTPPLPADLPAPPPLGERPARLVIAELPAQLAAVGAALKDFDGPGSLVVAAPGADAFPAERTWLHERAGMVDGASVVTLAADDHAALASTVLASDALVGVRHAHPAADWARAAGIPLLDAPTRDVPRRAAVDGLQGATALALLNAALSAVRSGDPPGGGGPHGSRVVAR